MENTQIDSVFVNDQEIYNKKTQAVPKPKVNIGIDTDNTLFDNIIEAGENQQLDISKINSFTQLSQSRDQLYALLDTMGNDSVIAAVLETYAEDATEYNDKGQIVWAESSDPNIAKYITFLLNTIQIDKNIYKWTYSLCKYGDLYVRLYKTSECEDELFPEPKQEFNSLNEDIQKMEEDIKLKAYDSKDKYTHYVEMVANPAEMFELSRFGKTQGYIKAPVGVPAFDYDNMYQNQQILRYSYKQKDIEIYDATMFVHASLEDNVSRTPEEVEIFLDKSSGTEEDKSLTYSVKRGQSLLQNVFKVWRELMLLQNSILLNRLTKSSIVRVINVEVGDMPKTKVGPHLQKIKSMIEQKSAINEGKSMAEYTNPGPIENNIYVPTHGGIGALTTQQIGGDVDVKSLADIDYFKDRLFGALRVPKQYFGDTDDSAGFNGGTSLSIISSRYAKMIKRIQNTLIQMITDMCNLMLINKGLTNYINKFQIHMLPPTTQEEIDRRDNLSSKVAIVNDIMNLAADIDDTTIKLKMLKSLLSNTITDSEILQLIQDEIDRIEQSGDTIETEEDDNEDFDDIEIQNDFDSPDINIDANVPSKSKTSQEPSDEIIDTSTETVLPNGEELGVDLTNNNNF